MLSNRSWGIIFLICHIGCVAIAALTLHWLAITFAIISAFCVIFSFETAGYERGRGICKPLSHLTKHIDDENYYLRVYIDTIGKSKAGEVRFAIIGIIGKDGKAPANYYIYYFNEFRAFEFTIEHGQAALVQYKDRFHFVPTQYDDFGNIFIPQFENSST